MVINISTVLKYNDMNLHYTCTSKVLHDYIRVYCTINVFLKFELQIFKIFPSYKHFLYIITDMFQIFNNSHTS